MARTGRPPINIDRTLFEDLCGILCTQDEIVNILHCSISTIERWCKKEYNSTFEEIHKKLTANGKASLRRMQYKAAMDGNVTMLIWLGKQFLSQKEPPREDWG